VKVQVVHEMKHQFSSFTIRSYKAFCQPTISARADRSTYGTIIITATSRCRGVHFRGKLRTLRHWNFRGDCNKFGQSILRKI